MIRILPIGQIIKTTAQNQTTKKPPQFALLIYRPNSAQNYPQNTLIFKIANMTGEADFRPAGVFHWASTSQATKHLPPLKQAENACVIENGSQLLPKINNSLRISLSGIFASCSQVEGIRSLFVLFGVIGK